MPYDDDCGHGFGSQPTWIRLTATYLLIWGLLAIGGPIAFLYCWFMNSLDKLGRCMFPSASTRYQNVG